jgi:hypothetical protein
MNLEKTTIKLDNNGYLSIRKNASCILFRRNRSVGGGPAHRAGSRSDKMLLP